MLDRSQTWGPPRLHWIATAEAALSRRLHIGRASPSFDLGGSRIALHFGESEGEPPAVRLPLTIGTGTGALGLSRGLVRFALDRLAPGIPDRHPDLDLLLEAVLEEPLRNLEMALGRPVALGPPHPAAPPDLRVFPVRVTADGLTAGHARLSLPPVEAALLLDLLDRLPRAPNDLGALRFPVAVIAGTAALTVALLRSLRRDDIVLFDDAAAGSPVVIEIAGRRRLLGREASGGYQVVDLDGDRKRRAPTMDDRTDAPAETGHLDDLAVSVAFELGRRDLTLAELRTIRPGYVLELGHAPTPTLDLVIRGQIVGKAELVQIDDQLGARILRLFDHD
jgi:type III secretion protein Q